MDIKGALANFQDNVSHEITMYRNFEGARERVHATILDTAITATLGSITVAAEAIDIHLSSEPNTVKNNLTRAGCRVVALGAGYLTAQCIAELVD
jgi:hypothetical protein